MAEKVKTQKVGRKAAAQLVEIDVRKVTVNYNHRDPLGAGMSEKYSLFTGRPNDLWAMGISSEPEQRAAYCKALEEGDPDLVAWAATFLKVGQLEPVEVKKGAADTYTLVFGCRRCLAVLYNWCSQGGKGAPWVKAQLSPKVNQTALLHRGMIENIRRDPNPMERAHAWDMARNMGQSVAEIAQMYGYSEQSIRNALALLELPEAIQKRIAAGTLAPSKALKDVEEAAAQAAAEANGEPVERKPKRRPVKDIQAALETLQEERDRHVLRWVLGMEESL